MAVVKITYLWCDRLDCDEEFTDGVAELASDTRRKARAQGWRYSARTGDDFCPKHAKIRKA